MIDAPQKVIDTRLGNGQVIVEEAERAGLDLALACALVEQESGGFNVFGHDYPDLTDDEPPYYGHPVTKERVAALRASEYQNGVGLTQLTYDPFLGKADGYGGAHLPRYQCRVGFEILADLVDRYEYYEALGAYNAGEGNGWSVRQSYAEPLAAKHEGWKTRLNEGEGDNMADKYPTDWLKPNSDKWLVDDQGRFARVQGSVAANASGWLYGYPDEATDGSQGGDTIKEGTNSYKAIRYLEQLVGYMPYWVWESGPVPDGEGAYAVNGPPPPVPELRGQCIFCAGVPNLCRRIAGKIIPTRGNELYDGGVAAYFDSPSINELTDTRGFWAAYGLEEAFDLDTAKQWAYDTRSMVLIGREYTGGDGDTVDLASQGHVAILLPSGYVLQSFQADASGWPGLNWDYTIEESHDGGYYTRMIAPWNWLEF